MPVAVPSVPQALPEPGALSSALNAVDTTSEAARNESEYTHVSTLLNACPRQVVLEQKYRTAIVRQVNPGDRLIWALGKAAEHHARSSLIASFPDNAFGDWSCNCGKMYVSGKVFSEVQSNAYDACPRCEVRPCRYHEHVLRDEERRIVASPDLILFFPEPLVPGCAVFLPVEFKSKCIKLFDEQVKKGQPETENALQVLSYARILRTLGHTVPFSVIIYIAKDFRWGMKPYLEFRVVENGGTAPTLNLLEGNAEAIKAAREPNAPLPPRLGVCSHPSTSRAKGCSSCTMCFSLTQ
jgi:hypothetical protein